MEKHYRVKNILTEIIENVKKQDYLVYFRKITIYKIDTDSITYGTVSSFMRDNLQAKFYDIVLEATKKEF